MFTYICVCVFLFHTIQNNRENREKNKTKKIKSKQTYTSFSGFVLYIFHLLFRNEIPFSNANKSTR